MKVFFENFEDSLRALLLVNLVQKNSKIKLLHATFLSNKKLRFLSQTKENQNPENTIRLRKRDKDTKKYTGRYYLLIDMNKGFEIAKKIIGKKGKNMKFIIESCQKFAKLKFIPRDFLKLRLRGKGSLHREGNKKKECND